MRDEDRREKRQDSFTKDRRKEWAGEGGEGRPARQNEKDRKDTKADDENL